MITDGGRYALIIGNSQYTDETLQQLITPSQDVASLARVLDNPAIGNFNVEVKLESESHQLRREIERFFMRRKPTDTLLFYFSGHGVIEDYSRQLYLAVKDTEKDILTATAIPGHFIRQSVGRSYAGSKIVILDCCYSGAITNDMLIKSPLEVAIEIQFEGKGVVFLSASTAWQYAFQETGVDKLKEGTQSLFTRFLVQGLETGDADLNGDGEITIDELYDYVFELVRKATPDQTPAITGVDQQGDIVVAKSVKSKQVVIPKVIWELLNSHHHPERVAGIRCLSQLATYSNNEELAQLAIGELKKIYSHEINLDIKKYAESILTEVGVLPLPGEQGKLAFQKTQPATNIQSCSELIDTERWREAVECFRHLLQQDYMNTEARQGFDRAQRGEEAILDFRRAMYSLVQNRLDDTFELLTDVVNYEKEYNIQIKGAYEVLQKVSIFKEVKAKREEAREAERKKEWLQAEHLWQEIVRLDPKDERAKKDLQKATQERVLQALYRRLLQNIDEQEWIAAEEKIKSIEKTRPNYENLPMLKKMVEKNKQLAALYSDLEKDIKIENWDDAIETCQNIIREVGGKYKDVYQILERAERAQEIKVNYEQAILDFRNDQLKEASDRLQFILRQDPDHKKAERLRLQVWNAIEGKKILSDIPDSLKDIDLTAVGNKLEMVKQMLDGLDENHPAYKAYQVKYNIWQTQWNEEASRVKRRIDNLIEQRQWKLAQVELDKLVTKKFIDRTDEYYDLSLVKIRSELRRSRWEIISLIVGIIGIFVTIFTLDYAGVMNIVENMFLPSPTVPVILKISRIEVLLNGNQINLDKLPNLDSGKGIDLEIIVFDTSGVRYTGEDLTCTWIVTPLGDKDVGINTDRCQTRYIPSQEYSSQRVEVKVEGSEQQFQPVDPILMKFNIIK